MRTVERERLNFLRQKLESGFSLTDKENERLFSLTELEKNEGGKANGWTGSNGNIDGDNPGSGNRTSGEIGGKGPGIERSNGDSTINNNDGYNNEAVPGAGQVGNISRGIESESGGPGGNDSGSNRTSDNAGGYEKGTAPGNARNSGAATEQGKIEKQNQGPSNLKPKDVKPKRSSPSNKKEAAKKAPGFDPETIGALIQTGFGLVANVTRHDIWNISNDEAMSIAEPTHTLLSNLSAKQKKAFEKYSAPLMLAAAVAGVVLPRAIVEINQMGGKKKYAGSESNRNPVEVKPVGTGDINTGFELNTQREYDGDSGYAQNVPPVTDKVIAGLFDTGN